MQRSLVAALCAALVGLSACAGRAADVAVPSRCDAAVNARLAQLIAERHAGAVDNVMVCGTTIAASRSRHGSRADHALIPLRVPLATGSALVEVVTNDVLDGHVTAPRGARVAAYGQYFLANERQRPFVAGIHETHCATHRGADNGWVVVNGTRYPQRRC
jgi:hypothetical protein